MEHKRIRITIAQKIREYRNIARMPGAYVKDLLSGINYFRRVAKKFPKQKS